MVAPPAKVDDPLEKVQRPCLVFAGGEIARNGAQHGPFFAHRSRCGGLIRSICPSSYGEPGNLTVSRGTGASNGAARHAGTQVANPRWAFSPPQNGDGP